MRFLKAGGIVLILASTALGMPAHAQSTRQTRVLEPVQRARQLLTIAGGTRIGISIADVSADDVKSKKLAAQVGAVVEDVADDTPAAKAGLKAGDVVLEFDGERVRSARQLTRLIQETPPGRQVAVVVSRDGQRMNLSVTTDISTQRVATLTPSFRFETARPSRAPRPPQVLRGTPVPESLESRRVPNLEVLREGFAYGFGGGRLGVGTETLTGQLAKHFGVERGVLVKDVFENSAASKAGLRAGDVITKVNGASVGDTGDLLRALGEASGEISLEIVRDRKTQTLKATLEAPRTRTIRRVI